jgi:hypothetical protein
MGAKPANSDQVIARIAARQHGIVTVAQLRDAGIGHRSISRRVKAGRLHRVHRGVYAVGHTKLTFEGRCMAAVLALGEGSAVSHRSAAALWRMLPPHAGPIEVIVRGDGGREKRKGIRIHRSSTLSAGVSILRDGIRITKAARTLQDLHRSVPAQVYQRAVRRALDLRLIRSEQLESEPDLTRSELERLFLALCRRHRLPRPEVNARVGSHEVDSATTATAPPSSATGPGTPAFRARASGFSPSPTGRSSTALRRLRAFCARSWARARWHPTYDG